MSGFRYDYSSTSTSTGRLPVPYIGVQAKLIISICGTARDLFYQSSPHLLPSSSGNRCYPSAKHAEKRTLIVSCLSIRHLQFKQTDTSMTRPNGFVVLPFARLGLLNSKSGGPHLFEMRAAILEIHMKKNRRHVVSRKS